ncbi:MAG: TlpA disulfide reductase family protein [Desulfovibrionales bacterium]|nr:TlpA disulfide reductase family protein [Desulfovibrionales bacterium]
MKAGDSFPDIPLSGSLSSNDEKYLGLLGRKAFSLSDIRPKVLWIEVFSIYCAVCQRQAAKFNRLYELVQKDDLISGNMKMIGIGTGNNDKEVAHFRKYHDVMFPLIADPDFKVHEALKKARTPLVILLDKRSRPYKILTILDPASPTETLIKDIRAELHKINPAH